MPQQHPQHEPAPPDLRFVFQVRATVSKPIDTGPAMDTRRRMIPITGGTVEGPRLSGRVLSGGADWQVIHADGTADLIARYIIEAADGTLITVVNRGLRHGPPEVLARLAAGEMVDPALIYFRATPRLEAPPGPHFWMARAIFVCKAARRPDAVELDFFEVL
jgi:hypothetical protein